MSDADAKTRAERRIYPSAVALVVIPSGIAFLIAPQCPVELQKSLYAGAVTLIFAGLLGGMLKILLDEVTTTKRKRQDASTFVLNFLADLKSVYDRVGRARILIPAHQSVKTYGDEMRDLIEARVQLRNVMRALERRAAGMEEDVRKEIIRRVAQMECYLERLTSEFRIQYKALSDLQRAYEERSKVVLKRFAEADDSGIPPELPHFAWARVATLKELAVFMGEGAEYKTEFETALDDASEFLRNELARIVGSKT